MARTIQSLLNNKLQGGVPLTRIEKRTLLHLSHGLREQEVASKRGRKFYTVRGAVNSIYSKLGARNRPHAVAIALREGIIK